MIARGKGGKIINIGSLASEVARVTIAPYTAAKGGIKMLTRSMAAEWARHNIQANAIGPGYIASDMTVPLMNDAKFDAWVKGRTPSGRWGQPEDLIGVTIFLASAASDYVNGQIVYVDGGLLAVI
jgi:gluconate 5-dehydrogenase